jgi:hypothetical protein
MIRRGKHVTPWPKGRTGRRFGRVVPLALAFVMLMGAVALADNVVNDVSVGGTDTFTLGESTTVDFWIVANSGDGQAGCNASDGSNATVSINTPAAVTASPNSLGFAACGTAAAQSVEFTATAAGEYPITVSVSDAGTGTYNTQPGGFTLHVLADETECVPAYTATFYRPLDANGVINSFKNGRVIPVKVSLTDDCADNAPVTGATGQTVTVKLNTTALTGGAGTDALEEYGDAGQSSGNTNLMRWSEADGFWIYNLDSKALGLKTGSGYALKIVVDNVAATQSATLSPTK